METELSKTSEGQERLGRAKDRLDTRVAEIGQAEINREEIEHESNQAPQQDNINENGTENGNDLEGAGGSRINCPRASDIPVPPERAQLLNILNYF